MFQAHDVATINDATTVGLLFRLLRLCCRYLHASHLTEELRVFSFLKLVTTHHRLCSVSAHNYMIDVSDKERMESSGILLDGVSHTEVS